MRITLDTCKCFHIMFLISLPESYFVSVTFGTIISGLMFIFLSRGLLLECIFLYHIWDHNIRFNVYSNTPRLYNQWLNSVIYWLINHCTDWARTIVTSFSRQFDFHDVIYHNRRRNVVFTTP